MEPVVFKVGDTVMTKSSESSLNGKIAVINHIVYNVHPPRPVLVKLVDSNRRIWFNQNNLSHHEIPDNKIKSDLHIPGQRQPLPYKEEGAD